MKRLTFDQLPAQGVHCAMIEVLDNNQYGLTVGIDTDTYWVEEHKNSLYLRESIDDINDDLSTIAIDNLFLHYPHQPEDMADMPSPFAEYTLIGQNLKLVNHTQH
ncbi:Uncharacterised protein [BD1-7 clade bacterium]|uniref:Uncharacterized protein n=1 Tax=BD1-7 clade bacterium TaxID=2029982 RepID=A0A5S9NLG8_9GAMM|nr:Uncharacterised protein [BD1-7 clade bacterium]CAA0094215.1 Uncharacterised protein [BD1-7 clade bacterium]